MVSHNKIITAGNKRNTVNAFEIDTTVQYTEPTKQMRYSKKEGYCRCCTLSPVDGIFG